ncbi:MAG: hypothetical protein RL567_1411 [Bacteroidota bacterium]
MKTNNQILVDLKEAIQPGGLQSNLGYNQVATRISIKELIVKKGYHCKLNDIMYFCQKIENGEDIDPIEVNQNNMIVDGVKRYFAYKRLKYSFVQVKGSNVFIEEFIGEGFKIIK